MAQSEYLKRPYPRCIFCGERANSREHAIPAWIAKRFGLVGVMLSPTLVIGTNPPKQPISVANHRKRIFCEECNRHFKALEDDVIPIIEPMARGEHIVLGEGERRLLALWGAKTGIAIVAAEPGCGDLVPLEHRLTIRQFAKVPEELWVAYCPWRGAFGMFIGDRSLQGGATDPTRGYRAYHAVLMFAKLALDVFGFIQYPVAGHVIDGDRASIKQTWPNLGEDIQWPPPVPASEGNLQQLLDFVPLRAV
jgi:hypothetical protein